jgi:hypothetical protein
MSRIVVLLVLALGLAVALFSIDRAAIADFLAGPEASEDSQAIKPPAPIAREVALQTDLYSFDYVYPVQAAAIPGLAGLLDKRIEEAKARIEAEAKEARKEAKTNNYPFQPHYFDLGWSVAGDLPAWLSLQAGVQTYGGGAHPNQHFDTLLWDRKQGRALAPLELFTSVEVLDAALHTRYCNALDKERAERREVSIAEVRQDDIWECPGVADLTLVLESKGGKGFDHVVLLAAPYVAGPYVEGSYATELAVDKAVVAAVKPEYRSAFAIIP